MPVKPTVVELSPHEFVRPEEISYGERLGAGGSGSVYRGSFRGIDVAVKQLTLSGPCMESRRFEELFREVDALRFLRHPRLVGFFGACIAPPLICVLTEFMSGGSLYDLLHVSKLPLAWQQQHKISLQVTEALAFLHGHEPPVVHRDLKSMNVLLDRTLDAKLCDFGLTMPMDPNQTHIARKAGGESGSPRYMAPEFFLDTGRLTEKIDVWALGCVLIETFGGPLPYHTCESLSQICTAITVRGSLPSIPGSLPQALIDLIRTCLDFDITRRSSAQYVYSQLSQIPDSVDHFRHKTFQP